MHDNWIPVSIKDDPAMSVCPGMFLYTDTYLWLETS